MHFCFIVEEQYRNDSMPISVLNQLRWWGHRVDILEPQSTITCLSDLSRQPYDAYVLKTATDGPGLSILEAAEAAGIPTINHSRSIRLVRNKAVAVAMAQARGIPVPTTYFVAHPQLLEQVPSEQFPLVVKPANGSSCRDIYYINNPRELTGINIGINHGFWLAQHYEKNSGFDIKLYVAGTDVFAVAKPSPLHPDIRVEKLPIPVTPALRELALRVGQLFELDIFGVDVVETARGPMVVDINDFPGFGSVPEAEKLIATSILNITERLKNAHLHYIESLVLNTDMLVHPV